jgi:hypothetical protein
MTDAKSNEAGKSMKHGITETRSITSTDLPAKIGLVPVSGPEILLQC